ncbi:hypothetical protein GEMRC1_009336 [Eukaryota sp. GEM-RC1]
MTTSTAFDTENIEKETQEGYSSMLLDNQLVSIYTHDVHESAQAISLLTNYMTNLSGSFFPFLEQTIRVIGDRLNHYTIDLASTSLAACPSIIKVAMAASFPSDSEKKAYVDQVLAFLLPKILKSLSDSEADHEIASCCRSIEGIFRSLGPGNLSDEHGNSIITIILNLLNKLLHSQEQVDEEDAPEAGALEDDDQASLFITLVECLGTIAVGMSDRFIKIFANIWPAFSQMLTTYQPSEKADVTFSHNTTMDDVAVLRVQTSLCLLDDVIDHCGSSAVPVVVEALPFFLRFMSYPSEQVKQAAVYGAAISAFKYPEQSRPFIQNISNNLLALAQRPKVRSKKNDGTTDNVVSGLLRLSMAFPDTCPPANVWPLLMKLLPIKSDVVEVKFVYNILLEIIGNKQCLG